jgi:glutathione S-transferase
MWFHGVAASGNCYKVRMLLEAPDLPYEWREVDMMHGGMQPPSFYG